MNNSDWKEIRWNEALALFKELLRTIKDPVQQEWLKLSLAVISNRLAKAMIGF